MRFKSGVVVVEASARMKWAWAVCDLVTRKKLGRDAYVTSVQEGDHKDLSLHYYDPSRPIDLQAFAFDLRARELSISEAGAYAEALQSVLGSHYDVVVELKDDGTVSHIHVEYDPKMV